MIKVGITGQSGFVGKHLFNTLGLYSNHFSRINFENSYFQNSQKLEAFVSQCDVIFHLAALNRHKDPDVIYSTNMLLVEQIIATMERTNSTPHVLFASSTQEDCDNPYGKSKKDGRRLFERWADKEGAQFSGLVIPNLYGPFGRPYYNSVVATFCHQLTHNETPEIKGDSEIKLIYVGELVDFLIDKLYIKASTLNKSAEKYGDLFFVPHSETIKVSQLLDVLSAFKENYFKRGIIPDLNSSFERNLFNTFLCYIDHKSFFPYKLKLNTDERGSFVEVIKLNSGGQVSFSTTVPGITRGDHYHTRKSERFAVIKGKARIDIRQIDTDNTLSFELDGRTPSFVDMPVWHTHNITNIGDEELYTIFWISEHFNQDDQDTFFEKV